MRIRTHLTTFSFILIILSSCATVTSFDSPNNLGNLNSILYLKDGRSITGKLSFNIEHKKSNKVSIQSGNYSKPQFYKLKNVKGYSIGDDYFFLKEVDNNTIVIEKGNSLLEQLLTKKKYFFMKRLTPESSRIHLYENSYLRATGGNSNAQTTRTVEYYIQLPNDSTDKVYAIDSKKLLPNFELKMSALVSDCPVLANKISQKQPGYFYAPLRLSILSQGNSLGVESGLEDHMDVKSDRYASILFNIISEYNQCK